MTGIVYIEMLHALIHWFQLRKILLNSLVLIFPTATLVPPPPSAPDRVPTDAEIKKYRRSWNPLSLGSVPPQAVDTQRQGQLLNWEFLFSQIGESNCGNRLILLTDSKNGPVHLYQIC